MALIQCDFYSDALGLSTSMNVILPQKSYTQIGMASSGGKEKYPVLYLLHGLSDDHTIWLRRTSVERYAASLGLAIIMPAVHRSFYTDMDKGLKYWTFISDELPQIVRSFFPISDAREDTFAAGLSMGGYGAFKLALSHPERYAAAASLSGAVDMASSVKTNRLNLDELKLIYGDLDKLSGSRNDLLTLASEVAASTGPKPLLYQCCGTEDFLYEENQNFREHASRLNLDLLYEEGPGEHEWGYWDQQIQRVLKWLPL
ncbi:alpha/beta hydrolase [Gorillibacterium timonense]|uniref:alpha/beta hydrolase n=1 Tax=Gorillibacterium timonense TaxID=1689269 RepID=UPI00071E3CF4|nr:alpha/beta hydrolase family protein [Gorillibacterium timonense]